MRDLVSPAMRSAGLKGSAGQYRLPISDYFALAGFQRSTSSTASSVTFTMNLKVVSVQVWAHARAERTWLPKSPAANLRYPVAEWSARIGSLMPGGQDHWWWLRLGQPLEPLAAEVTGAFVEYGLPALRSATRQAS
jgi:hypothetical protein